MTEPHPGYRQLGQLLSETAPSLVPVGGAAGSGDTAPDPPTATPSTAQTLGQQNVDLSGSLPTNCALLVVESASHHSTARRFRLKFVVDGLTEESTEDDVEKQEVPDFSLTRIAERGAWEDDFYALRTWWAQLHQLESWLAKLLTCSDSERGNSSTRLLVWDTTDHQIPWELCYAHPPVAGGPTGWIGALIEVVRWTTVHAQGRESRYTGVQTTTRGRVLLLETDEIVDDSGGDGVGPLVVERGVTPERTLAGLVGQLGHGHPDTALVLIHCHGVDATNAQLFSLAEMTMNKLDVYDMPALASPGAVVLLNACNTAKLVPVSPATYRATRSFAELFLRKGAVSVIATLGRISLDHAYAFTEKLLNHKERRIAALLLAHRRHYAGKVTDPAAQHTSTDFENFFYGFMYVCFGHPDTVLELPGGAA
jgi:hypothetical protein